jgi:hypothetical protein
VIKTLFPISFYKKLEVFIVNIDIFLYSTSSCLFKHFKEEIVEEILEMKIFLKKTINLLGDNLLYI